MLTVDTLTKCGYSGKYYIVCDDEDNQLDKYVSNFGRERVLVFRKSDIDFDIMDNFDGNKVIVYARNVIFKFASDLGLDYFWELEDDYKDFVYRPIEYSNKKGRLQLSTYHMKNLDAIIPLFLDFLEISGALCVAFAQAGDLLGGVQGDAKKVPIKRKAMNTLFCSTKRPFQFVGRMNDDVNTYLSLGSRGHLFFHITSCALNQEETQKKNSGNTTSYLALGTYVKSFYSVMVNPSSCVIKMMRSNHPRIHHKINWDVAVPKIISSKFKKTT
jgi:hypothetical protein